VAVANWNFLATDIDEKSLKLAQHNVELNQWEDKIELRVAAKGKILKDVLRPQEK
jgi:23S rRNA A1618 N6-methylase RlmF